MRIVYARYKRLCTYGVYLSALCRSLFPVAKVTAEKRHLAQISQVLGKEVHLLRFGERKVAREKPKKVKTIKTEREGGRKFV